MPGNEAPNFIAWSLSNRTSLIRIPAARGSGTRIELRSADAAANPYFMLALCLRAGLDGIRHKIMPPAAISGNVYDLSAEELKKTEIGLLPGDLMEAVRAMEQDTFVMDTLGRHISREYVRAKKQEWNRYRMAVTDWEIREYFYQI